MVLSKQEYDEDDAAMKADDYKRTIPGITPFSGVGATVGKDWKQLMEQLEVHAVSMLRRHESILRDTQEEITDDNVEIEAEVTFNDLNKLGSSSALRHYKTDYFWTKECQQKYVDDAKRDMFTWFTAVFEGNCLNQIRKLGWEDVSKNLALFRAEYGTTLQTEIVDAEEKFSAGLVKPDKREMVSRDSLVDMLKLWEDSQVDLREDILESDRATHPMLTPDGLMKVVVKKIHPSYFEVISGLRYEMWLMELVGMNQPDQAIERAKGPGAWDQFPVSWTTLRERLVNKYKKRLVLWEAESKEPSMGKEAKLLAYGVVQGKEDYSGCWDCGSHLHFRGAEDCPCKNEYKFAPEWMKKRQTASSTDNSSNSNTSKYQKKFNIIKAKKNVCRFWKQGSCKQGKFCRFPHPESEKGTAASQGNRSRLKAPSGRQGDKTPHVFGLGRGGKKKRNGEIQSFSDKLAAGLVTTIEEMGQSDEFGRDGRAPPRKVLRTMIAQCVKSSNIFMIRTEAGSTAHKFERFSGATSNGPDNIIDKDVIMNDVLDRLTEFGIQEEVQIQAMLTKLINEDEMAFDNCAKCSASNDRNDFLTLNDSYDAKNSIKLVGVGGEAACGGRGAMLITLRHDKHGTWMLIDPDAIYVTKGEGDAPLRIISANKMEEYGMYIRKMSSNDERRNNASYATTPPTLSTTLKDVNSDLTIPLGLSRGLCVLNSVKRDTRNYRKNHNLKKVIALVREKRHCPVFKFQDLTETIAKAYLSHRSMPAPASVGNTNAYTTQACAGDIDQGQTMHGHINTEQAAKLLAGLGQGVGAESTKDLHELWCNDVATGARPRPGTRDGSAPRYSSATTADGTRVNQRRGVTPHRRGVMPVMNDFFGQAQRKVNGRQPCGYCPTPPERDGLPGGKPIPPMCKFWKTGKCRNGNKCRFTHEVVKKNRGRTYSVARSRGSDRRLSYASNKHGKSPYAQLKNWKSGAKKRHKVMPDRQYMGFNEDKPMGQHQRFRDDMDTSGTLVAGKVSKTAHEMDFRSAAGSNQTGRCGMSDGNDARSFKLADGDHTASVYAMWEGTEHDVHATSATGLEENYDNNSRKKFEDLARVVKFKTQYDTKKDYSKSLRDKIDKSTRRCEVYVMNVAALTNKQRAMLWHFRLGHMHEDVPIRLSQKNYEGIPRAFGVNVTQKLNCDCVFCDKAKFTTMPFKTVPRGIRHRYSPFFCVYIDGFGGQQSMEVRAKDLDSEVINVGQDENLGCKSIGGAVGGYVFVCVGSGASTTLLYSRKSQFPAILRRFILGVLALQWRIRIIRASDSEIVDNGEVEQICADHEILIQPTSQGSPEEMGRAEKSVGDTTRRARAMMLSASHLPPSLWGAAWVYSGVISWIVPKAYNDDMTPYQAIRGRPPNLKELSIGVFGCPCEVKRVAAGAKYKSKLVERTETMYFVGTDYPSMLVWLPSKNRIYRVSKRKVRLHEGAYVVDEPMTMLGLKERLVLLKDSDELLHEVDEHSIIDTVPTVRTLRIQEHQAINQGKSPQNYEIHLENNESIDCEDDRKFEEMLTRNLRKVLSEPSLQTKLLNTVKGQTSLINSSTTNNLMPSGTGYNMRNRAVAPVTVSTKVDNVVIENTSNAAKAAAATKAGNSHSSKSVDAVKEIELHQQQLPPLSRVKPGTRVQIKTKLFDPPEEPGYFSKGKPAMTYGTVRGRATGGIIKVLWDGDSRQVLSHWRDLKYLPAKEDPANEELVPTLILNVSRGATSYGNVFADCTPSYFTSVALSMGLRSAAEPYQSIANAEQECVSVCLKAASKVVRPKEWPRSFPECLINKNWRDWLEAVLKEHRGWMEFGAAVEVDRGTRDPNHALIRIGELYTRKRCGKPKFRPYAMGNLLTPNKDYYQTFSGTVTADTIRFFFSLATAMRQTVYQADARNAYLQSDEQQIPIYCYKPTYWDYVHMTIEELMKVRVQMLKLYEAGGLSAVKNLAKTANTSDNILLLTKPLYGIPSAGHSWATTLIRKLTGPELQMKRSCVDGCCYYKTNNALKTESGPYKNNLYRKVPDKQGIANNVNLASAIRQPHRLDAVWATEYVMMLTWTDDFPYFGTTKMRKWFEVEIAKLMKLEFLGECKDFVSIQIKQHEDGCKELYHSDYWLALKVKYKEQLGTRNINIPMKPWVEKTLMSITEMKPEEHEAVEDFPYRELIGSIAFPSCHTKLEIRFAVSILSRYLSNWNAECVSAALDLLSYCIHTHDIGILYSPGIDLHGDNTIYCYADSGFQAPRSQGCRLVKMNGGIISLSSQRHSTVDTSTTAAELTEAYLASNDVCGFRNMMLELGLPVNEATVLYEDNMPCIQLAEGERNLNETSRHMEIRVWKLRERIDMQMVGMTYCRTYDQLSDIGTKALPLDQFRYLRDSMNGYAAALLQEPRREMPSACIEYKVLIDKLRGFGNQDAERKEKLRERELEAKSGKKRKR